MPFPVTHDLPEDPIEIDLPGDPDLPGPQDIPNTPDHTPPIYPATLARRGSDEPALST